METIEPTSIIDTRCGIGRIAYTYTIELFDVFRKCLNYI